MKKFYEHYFEQLCIANQDVKHIPETDTAFYIVRDKYDLEEFDDAIRSRGHTPAMLLENYYYDADDANSENHFKEIAGRFNLLHKATVGDRGSIDEAHKLCESIAEEILAKMREELTDGATIKISDAEESKKVFFKLKKIKLDFLGPIGTQYYGVTVGFTWRSPMKAKSDPAKWA